MSNAKTMTDKERFEYALKKIAAMQHCAGEWHVGEEKFESHKRMNKCYEIAQAALNGDEIPVGYDFCEPAENPDNILYSNDFYLAKPDDPIGKGHAIIKLAHDSKLLSGRDPGRFSNFYDVASVSLIWRNRVCNNINSTIDHLSSHQDRSFLVFEQGNTVFQKQNKTDSSEIHFIPTNQSIIQAVIDRFRYGSGRELRKYSDISHFYSAYRGSGQYMMITEQWLSQPNPYVPVTIAIWSAYECPFEKDVLFNFVKELLHG